jgi:tetratricopeptide (TPR) repeat protein
MRFVQAYVEMKSSIKAFRTNDIEKAAEMMNSASNRVPESNILRGIAAFYKGILFLQQDNNAEALISFNLCRRLSPSQAGEENKIIDQFITRAAIGAAFDNKDYDQFLELSIKSYNENPNDAIACAQVSSAYACKYAVTGDEQFKGKSLDMLNKAGTLLKTDSYFKEYEQRILYRLYSREIITRNEFVRRFPNGWKEPQKE